MRYYFLKYSMKVPGHFDFRQTTREKILYVQVHGKILQERYERVILYDSAINTFYIFIYDRYSHSNDKR